ncbi:MAG: hypothetical protein KDA52_19680, partial [Planctomycetaceae bacterium]|nr:hypothetical protein [Planctomycetaceae bacterium]
EVARTGPTAPRATKGETAVEDTTEFSMSQLKQAMNGGALKDGSPACLFDHRHRILGPRTSVWQNEQFHNSESKRSRTSNWLPALGRLRCKVSYLSLDENPAQI